MIDNMDEKYRIIIELAYFQGFTQKEIEKELDIPLGTVKSRVKKALEELRKVFNLLLSMSMTLEVRDFFNI